MIYINDNIIDSEKIKFFLRSLRSKKYTELIAFILENDENKRKFDWMITFLFEAEDEDKGTDTPFLVFRLIRFFEVLEYLESLDESFKFIDDFKSLNLEFLSPALLNVDDYLWGVSGDVNLDFLKYGQISEEEKAELNYVLFKVFD